MDIYVGNLPYSATEEDVTGLFAAHGPVERVKIITDRETGRSKGFAFVTLGDQTQLEAAIEALNGYDFQGVDEDNDVYEFWVELSNRQSAYDFDIEFSDLQ